MRQASKNSGLDFDEVCARVDLPALIKSYGVDLTPDGNEWRACCPFHQEKTASFTVRTTKDGKQRYHCFGCHEDGDAVAFVAAFCNVGQNEARKSLVENYRLDSRAARISVAPRPAPVESWCQIVPVPADAQRPAGPDDVAFFPATKYGRPARFWAYTDGCGALIGYTCRVENPEGGKDILPYTYGQEGEDAPGWRFKAFTDPRPLYGLQNLAANPGAQVLVVEGEKTADAAQRLFPTLAVVTWPGGCGAVAKADWTPLAGRKVCIWPDADAKRYPDNDTRAGQMMPLDSQNGTKAALKIAAILKAGLTDYVRVVRLPDPATDPSAPGDGWDLADGEAEGWDTARAVEYLKAHLAEPWGPKADPPQRRPRQAEPAQKPAKQPQATPAPAVNDNAPPPADDYGPPEGYEVESSADWTPPPLDEDQAAYDMPFRCLGHAGGQYFFLPRQTGVIVDLAPSSMSRAPMLQLAKLDWWQDKHPGRNGVAWLEATDTLMNSCHKIGFYNPLRVRGRGAWLDEGRAVVHLGDRLIVDGVEAPIFSFKTSYIYEANFCSQTSLPAPAKASEAHRLVELCELLNWERPIYGKLLAGWCAVAHVCGALKWRPHIWVTGPSGSGKSWVYDNILRASLDGCSLPAQSNSTEAGLRQSIKNDAMPVIFDEAESETKRGAERIQNVLELMRQASSENGAAIVKGTANGQAQRFLIRSCFAFCSIVVAADKRADISRLSVLTLKANTSADRAERFARIQALRAEVLTPAFAARLRARSISLIHQIRENAATFAAAAGQVLGTQRDGDQYGALLAGAYSLHSDNIISYDDAYAWVSAKEWDEKKEAHGETDEQRLLSRILDASIMVDGVDGRPIKRNVSEVARGLLVGSQEPAYYYPKAAEEALARIGLRVRLEYPTPFLDVANSHAALERILAETPWGHGWNRILSRIRGAEKPDTTTTFAGKTTRYVRIPIPATPLADMK